MSHDTPPASTRPDRRAVPARRPAGALVPWGPRADRDARGGVLDTPCSLVDRVASRLSTQRTTNTLQVTWRVTFSAVVPMNVPHGFACPVWPITTRS